MEVLDGSGAEQKERDRRRGSLELRAQSKRNRQRNMLLVDEGSEGGATSIRNFP